jgi:hypothetical protein
MPETCSAISPCSRFRYVIAWPAPAGTGAPRSPLADSGSTRAGRGRGSRTVPNGTVSTTSPSPSETLDAIIAWSVADGADDDIGSFRDLAPMTDGLYSLGWGFATCIVTEASTNALQAEE